jgi:hypothetical protein
MMEKYMTRKRQNQGGNRAEGKGMEGAFFFIPQESKDLLGAVGLRGRRFGDFGGYLV